MNDEQAKRDYVKRQKQTRSHTCHWTGCTNQVPPAMWGCRFHWFALPKSLRDKVWATYQPGQEVNLSPSDAYLAVADEVQKWVREHTKAPVRVRPACDECGATHGHGPGCENAP